MKEENARFTYFIYSINSSDMPPPGYKNAVFKE